MARPKRFLLLGVFAALIAGCGGGPEEREREYKLSVEVSHEKYEPINTKVTRQVTKESVQQRIRLLGGDNESLRREAIADLVAFGRREPRTMGLIAYNLDNPDPDIRRYALIALAKIGPGSWSPPVDKMRKLLEDPVNEVKTADMFAIGVLKLKDRDIVKRVFSYLSDPNPSLRSYAAECIRELKYWPAIPALIYGHLAMENLPIQLRLYAWEALQNITLEHVNTQPPGVNIFAVLKGRADAWTYWWEANRHKYGG